MVAHQFTMTQKEKDQALKGLKRNSIIMRVLCVIWLFGAGYQIFVLNQPAFISIFASCVLAFYGYAIDWLRERIELMEVDDD